MRKLTILCASDVPGKETVWKTIIKEDVVDQTNITRLTEKVGNISFVTQNMPSGPDHIILEENCPFWPGFRGVRLKHRGFPEVIHALEPGTLAVMKEIKFDRLLGIGIDTLEKAPADVQDLILNVDVRNQPEPLENWIVYVKRDSGVAAESSGVH